MKRSRRRRSKRARRDFDKGALRKEIARHERIKAREKLASLKAAVRAHRTLRAEAKRAAAEACRSGRLEARERAKRLLAEAKVAAKEIVLASRAACSSSKSAHGKKLGELRRAYEDERRFQAEMRRIERANRARKTPGIASARVKRQESDDEVRQNIPRELIPLFDRVKRGIKGSSRMSRTEAFLKYVEENPREQYASAEDATDALIRELEARQRAGADRVRRRARRR